MTSLHLTDLYIKLGFNIIKTPNLNWIIQNGGYAHSFPTLDTVFPTIEDYKAVFRKKVKVLLFRTENKITNTFEYVFSGTKYEIEQFDSKIRNQIRKGLKSCVVKDADLNSLINNGFEINRLTLEKHGRNVDYLGTKDLWTNYITTLIQHEDVFIKGAYSDNILIGYIIFLKVNDKYIVYHPFIDHNFSSFNPMNALLYTFINERIEKEGNITVTYGLESFLEKSGLDKFKKGMLFNKIPITRVTLINPKFSPLINSLSIISMRLLFKMHLISESLFGKFKYLYDSKKLFRELYNDK